MPLDDVAVKDGERVFVREIDGKEELHLMILDDSVPAGSQLC